ncbi:MAG: dihydrodipicolinate synthase family protein [Candidatus Lokiarchaeota archaeon]|nr:dihydrodipicolinate synthase family protein [Candidatus Lokiarchaeota archaeon]
MKQLLGLRGIVTVLNTPFTASDEIDVDALQRNVQGAIDAGVAGFLVPAMASEVDKLTDAERGAMIAATLDVARGKVAVIGGASAQTAEARARYAKAIVDAGCDGVLASIPYQDDSQYTRDVKALAKLDPPFIMLQDWATAGSGLPVPLVSRLFEEVDAFKALKIEVPTAGTKYTQVYGATGGRLHLSGGWAVMQMIEGLDRGLHAFMPTGLHWTYTRIFKLYQAGRRAEARALFNKILPVLAFSNQHLDVSIHFFKRLLHEQGIYPTIRVREPIMPFDAVHERISAELVNHAILVELEAKGASKSRSGEP